MWTFAHMQPHAAVQNLAQPCLTIQSILKQCVTICTICNHMHHYATICNCSVQDDTTKERNAVYSMHHMQVFSIISEFMKIFPIIICIYINLQQYVNIWIYAATRSSKNLAQPCLTIRSIFKQCVTICTICNHMHHYATICNCSMQ